MNCSMKHHENTDGGDAVGMFLPARDRDDCMRVCYDIPECVAVTALTKHYGTECRLYWRDGFEQRENLNWMEKPETWTKECQIGM